VQGELASWAVAVQVLQSEREEQVSSHEVRVSIFWWQRNFRTYGRRSKLGWFLREMYCSHNASYCNPCKWDRQKFLQTVIGKSKKCCLENNYNDHTGHANTGWHAESTGCTHTVSTSAVIRIVARVWCFVKLIYKPQKRKITSGLTGTSGL